MNPQQPQVVFPSTIEAIDFDFSLDKEEKRLLLPRTPPTTERTAPITDNDEDPNFPSSSSQRSCTPSITNSIDRWTHLNDNKSKRNTHLRGNLTRQHKDRDPFSIYQRIRDLGNGSIGRVTLVRKQKSARGGSARYNVEARAVVQEQYDHCFQLPIIGSLCRWILKDKLKADLDRASFQPVHAATSTTSHESLGPRATNESNTLIKKAPQQTEKAPLYAMKSIHYKLIKDPAFVEELRNEIAVLKTLDHPHIVRIHETFDYDRQLFVAMEVCQGGDLYMRDPYSEAQAARITCAVLSAVAYMHRKGVIHRDIKYENILFVDKSPTADIKLIDFGLSTEIKARENLTDGVGTTYTMAPEVIRGEYSKEADLWSMGVVVFMLLSSQMPFYGNNRRDVIKEILKGEYHFRGRRWKKVSNQAKAFVGDLLILDPDERVTASQALASTWLRRRQEVTVRLPRRRELTHVKESIHRYMNYPRLRKLALMFIAHRSTSEDIGILRKVFELYDVNGFGHLTYEEFKDALQEAGFSDDDYRELFNAVDVEGTGHVSYKEFLAATIETTGRITEDHLAEAFDQLDHDDTGYITRDNLRYLFGHNFPEEDLDAILNQAASGDRGISYADCLAQWNDGTHWVVEKNTDSSDGVDDDDEADDEQEEEEDDFEVCEPSLKGLITVLADNDRTDFVQAKAFSERKQQNMMSALVSSPVFPSPPPLIEQVS